MAGLQTQEQRQQNGGQSGAVRGGDREAGFGQRNRLKAGSPGQKQGSRLRGLSCRHTGSPRANDRVASSPQVHSSPVPQHSPRE